MAFDKSDEAMIEKIAFAVGDKLMKQFEEKILFHAATCPSKKLWILYAGIAIGSGIGGVIGGAGLLRLFGGV